MIKFGIVQRIISLHSILINGAAFHIKIFTPPKSQTSAVDDNSALFESKWGNFNKFQWARQLSGNKWLEMKHKQKQWSPYRETPDKRDCWEVVFIVIKRSERSVSRNQIVIYFVIKKKVCLLLVFFFKHQIATSEMIGASDAADLHALANYFTQ